MRVVQSLVSHASLVYDERLFMKSYRVLEPAPRPEIELLLRLDEVGFKHLLGAVARWERAGGTSHSCASTSRAPSRAVPSP